MMSERRTAVRDRFPQSSLTTAGGELVTVVHVAAEYYPFARSGGLAEAVANLSRYQSRSGTRSVAFLPLYRSARDQIADLIPVGEPFDVPLGQTTERVRILTRQTPRPDNRVYFVEHDGFYDRPKLYGDSRGDYPDNHLRYGLFARAAVMALPLVTSGPILLHAHDWHAALALTYLRTRYADDPRYQRIGTVLSVHNAGYQGHYQPGVLRELGLPQSLFNWQQLEWYGKVNLLKAGLVFADAVVTVSPNHATELRTAEGGFGLQEVFSSLGSRFSGILNGIDLEEWDPAADKHTAAPFSIDSAGAKAVCKEQLQREFGLRVDPRLPIFSMAARLVTQKGLDLIVGNFELFQLDAQFIFIGAGEARFENALGQIAGMLPDRVAIDTNFHDALEHRVIAGADFLLMPCQYEPCGLTQMRAQRYGVAPIVRRVGGLADTVEDGVTGFVFDPYDAQPLVGASLRGIDIYHNPEEWRRMIRTAMERDFSWERSVAAYLDVYRDVVAERCG
ncbi:MAG: glycogen synthase [Gemmatimonadales bacterium]